MYIIYIHMMNAAAPPPPCDSPKTWSLRMMLDAGVRALDIRLRHVDDSFTLEHGIVELPYAFDEDVRDVLQAFVSENPTEAILVFYQINDLGPSTRTPEESLQESLDAHPNHWIAGSTIPTLGEARGKVVLANDMAREEQNEYDLATLGEVSGKKDLVRNFFLESDSAPAAWGAFRLNYFSGTGASVYPLTVAAGVRAVFQGTNEVLFEFSDGCLGVTMFDFIGEDAIAHVVAQQARSGVALVLSPARRQTTPSRRVLAAVFVYTV